MNHSQKLSTKTVCLITGYRGLAETLISTLSSAGVELSVLVRNENALSELKKNYPHIFFFSGDLSSKETLTQWIELSLKHFGQIDVLINNAAITGPGGKFSDYAFQDFEEAFKINFLMPAYLCHSLIPHFLKQGSGMVLNLSGGGATNARPHFAAYSTSKTAIVRLTENLKEEYPQLKFYALAPGALKTPMMEKVVHDFKESQIGKEFLDAKKRLEVGGDDPKKAAHLALWLIQEKPEHLNGRLISAIWDKYESIKVTPKDLWTLRRVDEVLIQSIQTSS